MKKEILIFCLFISSIGLGQIANGSNNINYHPINIPSPNAASLGTFGQIPVNLFNGLPNINIPLFESKNVDIKLSYNPLLVKPDQHSGWVGLGWNLNVGGAITRIVNGGVDEVISPSSIDKDHYSYYIYPNTLDRENWYNEASMEYYSEYTDQIGEISIPYPYPDEFIFNFKGISGSFYYDHKGKWVVKSNQPIHLKIKETLKTNFELPLNYPIEELFHKNAFGQTEIISRIFYGFEITTQDGVRYVFGNTQNSIEFNLTDFKGRNGNTNYIATTWYLTKIIKPNNEEVTFEYERNETPVFTQTRFSQLSFVRLTYNGGAFGTNTGELPNIIYQAKAMFLVYLKKISSNEGEIEFHKSFSEELKYNFRASPPLGSEYLNEYYQNYYKLKNDLHWHKLDYIRILNINGIEVKRISFDYLQNENSRLFLNHLEENSAKKGNKIHTFYYNQTNLPEYNSGKLDHWGYYNGEDFFEENTFTDIEDKSATFYNEYSKYFDAKKTDSNLAKAGVLEKIIYPTGGGTQFIYEPNNYSSIVEKKLTSYFGIQDVNPNKVGGGLRIKKIISNSNNSSSPAISKSYFYVNDYTNDDLSSSGILSGIPNYLEEGFDLSSQNKVLNYRFITSAPIEPMALTNGNHVTYSNVVELNDDGSYIEHIFSNHNEEQYRDSAPNSFSIYTNAQWKYFPFNSRALLRGKLLFQKKYNQDKKLVSEKKLIYNSTELTKEPVRALYINSRKYGEVTNNGPHTDFSNIIFGHNVSAFNIYTYFNYLEKEEEIIYSDEGSPITQFREFLLTPKRQLSKSTKNTSMNRKTITISNDYPQDIIDKGKDTDGIMAKLVAQNRITEPIETITYLNDSPTATPKKIASKKTIYKEENNLIVPHKLQTAKGSAIPEDRTIFDKYDTFGNILESHAANDPVHTVTLWGYKGQYPIARIENTNYAAVHTALGLEKGEEVNETHLSAIDALRSSNPSWQITTYKYKPLVGVKSITQPNGVSSYYEYDNFNRLDVIKDKNENLIKTFEYYYTDQNRSIQDLDSEAEDTNEEVLYYKISRCTTNENVSEYLWTEAYPKGSHRIGSLVERVPGKFYIVVDFQSTLPKGPLYSVYPTNSLGCPRDGNDPQE